MKLIKKTYRFSYYLLESESLCADMYVVWNSVPSRTVAILDYDKEKQKVLDITVLGKGLFLTETLLAEIRDVFNN